jgi:hypothetical protein
LVAGDSELTLHTHIREASVAFAVRAQMKSSEWRLAA